MHIQDACTLTRTWTRTVMSLSLIRVAAVCQSIGIDRALEMLDQKLAGATTDGGVAAPGSARAELEAAGLAAGMPSGGAAVPSGDLP